MPTEYPVVRLERTISASPDRVFRAWLEPDLVRRWMAPVGYGVSRVEVDERVGGHHRVWHTNSDGDAVGGFDCELVELVPDERIVFAWRFVGRDRKADPAQDSRLTITIREADGGATVLTLVHERLDALAEAMPEVAGNVEGGWRGTLGRLADVVEQA